MIGINWLFYDTAKSVESNAIVYLLVKMARFDGINPYDYLFYTITVMPYFAKFTSHDGREKLMP